MSLHQKIAYELVAQALAIDQRAYGDKTEFDMTQLAKLVNEFINV